MGSDLGERFARAVADGDRDALEAMLAPELDFRGLTPRRVWEAGDPGELIDGVLASWFDERDEITALEAIESDRFADRERVGYRLRVRNPRGEFVVEQQAYLGVEDGRIAWLRILCSGFRPV